MSSLFLRIFLRTTTPCSKYSSNRKIQLFIHKTWKKCDEEKSLARAPYFARKALLFPLLLLRLFCTITININCYFNSLFQRCRDDSRYFDEKCMQNTAWKSYTTSSLRNFVNFLCDVCGSCVVGQSWKKNRLVWVGGSRYRICVVRILRYKDQAVN